ncbi:MAG: SRPBCC family protein [Myxococcota bacterium]
MASSYTVERAMTMGARPEAIHPLIDELKAWQRWSPWEGLDPALERTYSGPDAGPGAAYAWKGNRDVGQGSMTIRESDAPGRVVIDLAFLKPFKSQSVATFRIEPEGEGSVVRWTMEAKHTFLSRVFSLFASFDKMIGKDFEKGLGQLKALVEG